MATADKLITFADIAKSTDPRTGKQQMMAELLNQSNDITMHAPRFPSNMPMSNRTPIRTDLPTVYLKRVNEGVPSSKSTRSSVEDSISLLESWATHEEDAINIGSGGNAAAVRDSENAAHLEAMGQKEAELIFYGSKLDDDREFYGIAPRYDSLTGNQADSVISCGGSTTNTSVYLVGWAKGMKGKVYLTYPYGSMGGLHHRDFDLAPITDPSGSGFGSETMAGYRDQFKLHTGLVVEDWRFIVRICNINLTHLGGVSDTQAIDEYGTALIYQMNRALKRIPNLKACNPKFYMNRSAYEGLDQQALALTTQNVFKSSDVDGMPVERFRGVEIHICDQILTDEGTIS